MVCIQHYQCPQSMYGTSRELHKRPTDQINSEIQMIDCGMVTQDVYCLRAQWLIKDQHRLMTVYNFLSWYKPQYM